MFWCSCRCMCWHQRKIILNMLNVIGKLLPLYSVTLKDKTWCKWSPIRAATISALQSIFSLGLGQSARVKSDDPEQPRPAPGIAKGTTVFCGSFGNIRRRRCPTEILALSTLFLAKIDRRWSTVQTGSPFNMENYVKTTAKFRRHL